MYSTILISPYDVLLTGMNKINDFLTGKTSNIWISGSTSSSVFKNNIAYNNSVSAPYSSILNGAANTISNSSIYSTILNGKSNSLINFASYSFINGKSNSISANYSASANTIIGVSNTINPHNANHNTMIGRSNSIYFTGSGDYAQFSLYNTIIGKNNKIHLNAASYTANLKYSTILGGSSNKIESKNTSHPNISSASIIGGASNINSNSYSTILSSVFANTNFDNSIVQSSTSKISVQGDAQVEKIVRHTTTSNATPSTISFTGLTNGIFGCVAYVLATQTSSGVGTKSDSALFKIEFVYKNVLGTGTITSPITTVIYADAGASTWTCIAAMNGSTNFKFTCTGQASKSISWVAKCDFITTIL